MVSQDVGHALQSDNPVITTHALHRREAALACAGRARKSKTFNRKVRFLGWLFVNSCALGATNDMALPQCSL